MNISGILVYAKPGRQHEVAENLGEQEGIEVHEVLDNGKIIITYESTGMGTQARLISNLHHTSGVISAAMVYHYFEEESDERAAQMKLTDNVIKALQVKEENDETSEREEQKKKESQR
ncbi:MAG: chaperone NapD [Magnetococcales bacterium]|nr:chaperone NapD [Magnetococcales bacterium]